MGSLDGDTAAPETAVTVRYWASARAAAGVAEESFPGPVTLAGLLGAALERHADAPSLERVLQVCSVLVDGDQVRTRAPEDVVVQPGATVEFLPPFAGG